MWATLGPHNIVMMVGDFFSTSFPQDPTGIWHPSIHQDSLTSIPSFPDGLLAY